MLRGPDPMTQLFTTSLSTKGSKTPVVLSHALGLDADMWSSTQGLWTADRQALAYDHRGHGRSDVPPGPYSMSDLVADAEAVITEWGRGAVIWIGLSLGGMVGQGLAIRRPDLVRGLVLAHTTARYPPAGRDAWNQRIGRVREGGMEAVVELVLQRYLTNAVRTEQPELAAALREKVLRTNVEGYVASCHAIRDVDWLGDLHRISVPTLVLAGEHDMGATPAMAEEIHRHITGSKLTILPGASHLSPLETPAGFEDEVSRFLEGT